MTVYLNDYTPPAYLVDTIELRFELGEELTRVHSRMALRRNPDGSDGPLVLNGQDLGLESLVLDGRTLGEDAYTWEGETLTIDEVPEAFTLEVTNTNRPAENTALEGLYASGGNLCTQCEAEGFRRITFFPDRPDVMAVYTTTLVADPARYPVLLSNGNPVEKGTLDDGRHYATWHDPSPKPSYLFALVAGDLACREDTFTTCSGREVALRIYVREPDLDKCEHALTSLQHAMRWDEEVYGRECDLDVYMIVAISDFNMGAMENKGLNIFNSRFVLASPETATDMDYENIEGVVAHEYFHNWSGNRVTCRDWFQLSLKEGFTVFRDQQFSADMIAPAIKRIDDVRMLRTLQFAEDAGPMAHPVRPNAYEEINNFYTVTVYEKGAEVVRMLHTLLGAEGFRRGSDLYFQRHDGQAVTVEDFVAAMADANGRDFGPFLRWYDQAGTPVIEVDRHYDPEARTYTLTLRQDCPETPDQKGPKQPFHIPVRMGLLDPDGEAIPLRLEGEETAHGGERVLELNEAEQTFRFVDCPAEPVPSLLRGFSAPVKLNLELSDDELAFLMAQDGDDFGRWEAGQRLALRVMLRNLEGEAEGLDDRLAEAFGRVLNDPRLDPALIAEALTLPSEEYLGEFLQEVDPAAVHGVRQSLRRALADTHHTDLAAAYRSLTELDAYRIDPDAMGRRRLKNLALAYWTETGQDDAIATARRQFDGGQNMTDVQSALTTLVHTGAAGHDEALEAFYRRWQEDALVLDKWFAIQASSPVIGTVDRVSELMRHPAFTLSNPNRVRAVVASFARRNPVQFHAPDGRGYAFLADRVLELDPRNPQLAAQLLTAMTRWRRYEPGRREGMLRELERVAAASGLSNDVREIVDKSLR